MPDPIHEKAFVLAFVLPEKRERYDDFMGKPKRRWDILNRFNHFFDFVPAHCQRIKRTDAAGLAKILRSRGASDVGYVMGGDNDGETLPLQEAINGCLGSPSGAVISCIPGKLALYLQEFPPGDAFLLTA